MFIDKTLFCAKFFFFFEIIGEFNNLIEMEYEMLPYVFKFKIQWDEIKNL